MIQLPHFLKVDRMFTITKGAPLCNGLHIHNKVKLAHTIISIMVTPHYIPIKVGLIV